MTCCIGKARIYFREPLHYWLVYQLPDGGFGSVTAPEPLSIECIPETSQVQGTLYQIFYKFDQDTGYYAFNQISSIVTVTYAPRSRGRTEIQFRQNGAISSTITQQSWQTGFSYYLLYISGNPPNTNYTFKVIGEESGTVYAEIGGLEECPTVISNICLMGEEKYIDVEMGQGLPLLPAFIPDCLVAVTGWPLPEGQVQIRKLTVKPPDTNPLKAWKPIPKVVLTLNGVPGCPAEYRIVCCPDGECEPKEKCPPDTDCSLDCGDYVCCYKNGKVIKTVKK